KNSKIGNFNETKKLENSPCAKLNESLEYFFKGCHNKDLILLYFSGHGIKDSQGNLYFIAQNTKPSALRSTAVSAAYIKELLDICPAQNQILIFDCTFSTVFSDREYPGNDLKIDLSQWFKGSRRIILSAFTSVSSFTQGKETPDGFNKTKFTHYLVQGLSTGKADKNGDGIISIDELYEYVSENIHINMDQQTPGMWVCNQSECCAIAESILGEIKTDTQIDVTEPPEAESTDSNESKPVYTITKSGWKNLKKGNEYTFYFLYTAIDKPSTIAEQSITLLEKEAHNLMEYITKHIKSAGGKIWLSKKENYEHIILFPYDGKNMKKVFRSAFLLMLYKKLFDFETSCLEQPLSFKVALHLGNTQYYPDPTNIPLVSNDINYVFHFGEQIKPDYIYITEDIKNILPTEYTRYLLPLGDFRSKDIYRIQFKFNENCT
ncbi:MAG: hypothetical protein JXJ04_05325, partial [Spirochaetales bacterium]|nr:hypothetical protein [Spirochaetales bacterium]